MSRYLILTLTGRDRVGLVDRVTEIILKHQGNIEASRMARLGGEFAALMLVSVPEETLQTLRNDAEQLQSEGFAVTVSETEELDQTEFEGWVPHEVEVRGADHQGIIHRMTRRLAELRVNIESMETNMVKAPMSGTPLFTAKGIVLVHPGLSRRKLANALKAIGDELNVDVEVRAYTGSLDQP